MNFQAAYAYLKQGMFIQLPENNEYWRWDNDAETIMMHLDTGLTIDIRESKDVQNLLEKTFRTDWEIKEFLLDEEILEREPYWWEVVNFAPNEPRVLKRGASGPEVVSLQNELNRVGFNLKPDGDFGPGTERAVRDYQRRMGLVADGVFGDRTAAALEGHKFPESLSEEDLVAAAKELKVDVASIKAISHVESSGMGFFPNGKPAILYERHWMRRRLIHYKVDPAPFITKHPGIVNTIIGGYLGGVREYGRLEKAIQINETAALESASWGRYQIMGFHWEDLGYSSVQEFVRKMELNEAEHLKALVKFIQNDTVLLKSLRNRDWLTFARRYNGPAQKGYDKRLDQAFKSFSQLAA